MGKNLLAYALMLFYTSFFMYALTNKIDVNYNPKIIK